MQEKSLSGKVIINTVYNAAGRMWAFLIAFILTPYIINKLGVERFGVWAIIGVLTGYIGLLDFGIGSSFVKYISEFYTRKDYKKINEITVTGLIFYFFLAILLIVGGFLLLNPLLSLFKIPAPMCDEAAFVFLTGIIIFALSNPFSVFSSIQGGLQRMDISNKIYFIISIPNILGTIYVLETGYGLPGLMILSAIIFAITSIVNVVIAYKIFPDLNISLSFFKIETLKKLFNYGYKLQVARLATLVAVHIDKLLIGSYISIGLVVFYQLAGTIIEQAKAVILLFVSALLPAFSELDAKGHKEKLVNLYVRGTKYLSYIAVPFFFLIFVLAPQIMHVWMGDGYEKSVWIIRILAPGWLYALLAAVRGTFMQAVNRLDIEMRAGLVAAVVNIPLSLFFIVKFGILGVALGTTIALFFSATYSLVRLHRVLKIPIRNFLGQTVLWPLLLCSGAGLPVLFISVFYGSFLPGLSRGLNLAIFLSEIVFFSGLYLVILCVAKPFDEIDRNILAEKIPLTKKLVFMLSKKRS
ncbi:MAG: hypothetical protein A2452_01445 [Candidatus Firestonebacteria bacterium RIFOXYC2_FULL_39_67]|nr:MAG: hypothetical protein A2536_03075 [Candidatus Firestonebacteria bacterium RIFOXYD2_FULL_39_29]OGF53616.1 MAG: hypothetical protein A2452_01445 [Candidatus Firestonebacteria bacterium RIFOXYC2_FULL_39_67]